MICVIYAFDQSVINLYVTKISGTASQFLFEKWNISETGAIAEVLKSCELFFNDVSKFFITLLKNTNMNNLKFGYIHLCNRLVLFHGFI